MALFVAAIETQLEFVALARLCQCPGTADHVSGS